ncbi:MAG: tetratricopeptide repeat protein [Fimbriimonadales bacterium]|nr:tetratricopeptide repeat protein [Fimbriimonadales bacterium]
MQISNGKTAVSAQVERLTREAMGLYEQGRLEEALLACEGALALDDQYAPALSLKGLIHERRGQIGEAIAAYERVQAVNPLSVAERARLEALRRQSRAVVRPAVARPLWLETLPAAFAFLTAGLTLLVGFALLLRWSAPAVEPSQAATSQQPTTAPHAATPSSTVPPPPHTESPSPSVPPTTPPLTLDPSRMALAPAEPPPAPRGSIPTLPATPQNPNTHPKPKSDPSRATQKPTGESEVMPDVKVEETQRGVYEIRVQRVEERRASDRPAVPPSSDLLAQAQDHQRAGNYQEAIQAYLQALPSAPNPAAVHQQIAICYLRLGDKANARVHFQQAIAEYERQIQAGRDVETARQGIVACQNGLALCNE